MQKYIITGKNSQETAASMLNKPQNRREITEPLARAFGAEFIEFLYHLNGSELINVLYGHGK